MKFKKLIVFGFFGLITSASVFASDTCMIEKAKNTTELQMIASRLVDSGYKVIQFYENSTSWYVMACKQK